MKDLLKHPGMLWTGAGLGRDVRSARISRRFVFVCLCLYGIADDVVSEAGEYSFQYSRCLRTCFGVRIDVGGCALAVPGGRQQHIGRSKRPVGDCNRNTLFGKCEVDPAGCKCIARPASAGRYT